MPAPKFVSCPRTEPHGSHFWEPEGYNIHEGDALNWCEGVHDADEEARSTQP